MTTTLRDTTLQLLKCRPASMTLEGISEQTELPLPWLKLFSRGGIEQPSVNRIQVLYEYLSGTKLVGGAE